MRLEVRPCLLILGGFVSATGCARSTSPDTPIQPEPAAVTEALHSGSVQPQRPATMEVQPTMPTSAMLLVCSPECEVQFGVVLAGGRKEGVFSLTNPTEATVEVAEIKISCECLNITLPTRTIGPGEVVPGRIVLDLASEPETTGKLGVEVEGFAERGETAFAFTVLVEIPESGPHR